MKLSWDEPVPHELHSAWKDWIRAMNEVTKLRFKRCIKPLNESECVVELHHFSDASERSFGSCTYLRSISRTGEVNVVLVMSRGKVAPIKKATIPRLELEAAVLSAKADTMLKRELDLQLSESTFWVDSQIVLQFIANESRRFHTFVANRISLIHQQTNVSQWHYVPSSENVADVITRGGPISSQNWVSGPRFLSSYRSEWPVHEVDRKLHDLPEMKPPSVLTHALSTDPHPMELLCGHYSDWFALKRAVAWLLRCKKLLRMRNLASKGFVSSSQSSNMSVQELKEAESEIIKHVQSVSYSDEIARLSEKLPLHRSSALKMLDPFLDSEGLLRVGGRLRQANSANVSKHAILIPHKHAVAKLISSSFHTVAHLGTEWVVSLIRRRYWITKIRSVVKSVAKSCVTCKKLFASTCNQKMADLPASRLEPYRPPFTFVGIDCFGPIMVKRARSEAKRYVCLFCCFTTRAVHLELLSSMDTDSFINAFQRFIARRGLPERVWSDNGTNFVGGQRALFNIDPEVVQKFALRKKVDWMFQTPMASHKGGVWERLIRTVRKVLVGIMPRNSRLTDECLQTVLCEVESIVNSRPLTKVSDDIRDESAITPNHLLLLNQKPVLSPGVFDETDLYRRRWKCVQHLANEFWRRWIREYLPDLNRRQKWFDQKQSVKIGDLVLLQDESVPRGVWPMGIVTDVKQSSDNLVRSVNLRLRNGKMLLRPVTKLVMLECSDLSK